MAAPIRTAREREFDLGRIARWHRLGLTAGEIAKRIGVTRQQIQYDLRELRQRWVDAQLFNINEAKALELERLDALQEQATLAFEHSKTGHKRTSKQSEQDGAAASHTIEESAGDPRYLAIKLKCIAQRCTILGLYGPVPIEQPAPVGRYRSILEEMTVDELRTLSRVLQRTITAPPARPASSTLAGSPSAAPLGEESRLS